MALLGRAVCCLAQCGMWLLVFLRRVSLSDRHTLDPDLESAGRSLDIHDLALFPSHQRRTNRGLAGNLAFFKVHLVRAYNGIYHSGIGGHIRELHLAEQ